MVRRPDTPRWVTTTEAAQRLGVKRATLYAYVSRGVLHSVRQPGQQESLFDRAQVDALAGARRQPSAAQPLLRLRSVASSVSSHTEDGLLLRGRPVGDLVDTATFEQAAALVLPGLDLPRALGEGPVPLRRDLQTLLAALPLGRRLPVLTAAEPWATLTTTDDDGDLAPGTGRLLTTALSVLGHPAEDTTFATRLLHALTGGRPTAAPTAVLDAHLVAHLDHGLTVSTVAARVAASTRAPWPDCLAAAYAAMAGPVHGAAADLARPLLQDALATSPTEAAARALAVGRLPGFGHVLYTGPDPRAEILLERLWRVRGTAPLRRTVDGLVRLAREEVGVEPNIDLASAAVLVALDLPPGSGLTLFQVARTVGLVAHVVEELDEAPLRWRGRVLD